MIDYFSILFVVAVVAVFLVAMLLVGRVLRPAESGRANREAYECGNEPPSYAHDHRFSIRYYLIAVLFVIFEVETIFLYPWAVMFDRLALFGFIEMVVFLGILIIGYVYVWRRGALNWA